MASGKSFTEDLKKQLESKQWSFKTITALVLFGAIIMVFVFFGYNTKHDAGGQGQAARVNDAFISLTDLDAETRRLEQFYSSLFGGQMPPGAQRQFMQNQALENLISSELMAQTATSQHVLATDDELRDFILNDVPAFQEDGKFRRDRYEQILAGNGWTAGVFETRVRKDRQVQRVRRLLEAGLEPMKLELEKVKELDKTKLNLQFARLEQAAYLKNNPVTDAVAKERLTQPDFKKKVSDEFALKKVDYDTPAQIRASHILIKTGEGVTEQQALAKINDIRKQAEKGDFAKLAKQYSEDGGSKEKGGDLGYFSKGRMVPEFEAAAEKLAPGELSAPVKSQFGYHLIKVVDKKAETQATLEKFETEIAKQLISTEHYDAWIKGLEENLAKGDSASVDQKLKEAKFGWEESGYFGLGVSAVPKIGNPAVLENLSDLLKNKSYIPKVLREGPVGYVVKYKDLKVEENPAAGADLAGQARQRSTEVLANWVEESKKTAVVERNQKIQVR